jgi:hypothetical protein
MAPRPAMRGFPRIAALRGVIPLSATLRPAYAARWHAEWVKVHGNLGYALVREPVLPQVRPFRAFPRSAARRLTRKR